MREDGARVRVPYGTYIMRKVASLRYEFSCDGGPKFELALLEVSTYVYEKVLKIDKWPG